MFGTIRRHQGWLWWCVIIVIVISFVIYFSPYSRMNSSGRRGPVYYGSINGEKITEEDFYHAQHDVLLHYFFSTGGRWLNDEDAKKTGFDPQRETYQWLLLLQKEQQFGIHVGTDEAAQLAKQMVTQFERELQGGGAAAFVTQVLQPHGFRMEDFERFCRHQLALQQLMEAVGVAGKLVTPDEAKEFYARNYQEISADVVFFSVSNYLAGVTVTPDALLQFYTNQMPMYRIPERVQVRYVEYPVSNYLASAEKTLATNLAASVDATFQQLGTNYLQLAKTPEEAKTKIRERILRQTAFNEAAKDAQAFTAQLDRDPPAADDILAVAKSNSLPVLTTAPFDRENGPKELEASPDFVKMAFSLNPDLPFGQPVAARNGVYVLGFLKRLPSENPPYDHVKDRVAADYKFQMALQHALQAGNAFHTVLTNGLAQGKSFSTLCLASQLQPVALPAFSGMTRDLPEVEDRASLEYVKQAAFFTPPGSASGFVWPKQDVLQHLDNPGGFILFVRAHLPLDQAKMATELPKFTAYLRQKRTQEAFNLWFNREAQKGLMDTPLFQQRQQPIMDAGAGKS